MDVLCRLAGGQRIEGFLLLHPYPPTRGYGVKGMILLAKVRKKY